MIMQKHRKTHGFSLAELVIVMGVIGVLLGGIWSYAGSARQSQRVATSVQSVLQVAQGTRDAFVARASLPNWGVSAFVPKLIQASVIPANLMRSSTSICDTITTTYADTPWSTSQTDGCGTFRVCAWSYGTDTVCQTTIATVSSYLSFAIEFTQLDYGSCLLLAQGVTPYQLAGLQDVYINGNSMVAHGGLPVAPSVAAAGTYGCTSGSNTNKLDFIYTLRTPGS